MRVWLCVCVCDMRAELRILECEVIACANIQTAQVADCSADQIIGSTQQYMHTYVYAYIV